MTLNRNKRLSANPDATRAWQDRSRANLKRSGGLPNKSARRKAEEPERDRVRAIVIERAGNACQYADFIPEQPCRFYPWANRAGLEVDELRGGSHRSTEYLNPDQCRAACPGHHDWKTAHKNLVLERMGLR